MIVSNLWKNHNRKNLFFSCQKKLCVTTQEQIQAHILFNNLDIRVGQILECEKHPKSEKLYISKVDIGNGIVKTILSGLQKHVE